MLAKMMLYHFLCRFLVTSNVPEFAIDGNFNTFWSSNNTASSAEYTVGLATATSLSKMFVYFAGSLPPAVELRYMRTDENTWTTLQQYSNDCLIYFNTPPYGR